MQHSNIKYTNQFLLKLVAKIDKNRKSNLIQNKADEYFNEVNIPYQDIANKEKIKIKN